MIPTYPHTYNPNSDWSFLGPQTNDRVETGPKSLFRVYL